MTVPLVVTVAGPDRPGIVDALSKVVASHAANWEESRMARLAGTFAGILKVTVSVDKADALKSELEGLASDGLTIVVSTATGEETPAEYRSLELNLIGADHEGIVRDVSRVLVERGVNIEELATETIDAPMAGHLMFRATLDLKCPPSLEKEDLQHSLEQLADDLVVDITLEPGEG